MRQILAAAAALAVLAPAAAYAETYDASFEILRKGDSIGYHRVDVERVGDDIAVATEIRMKVKLGPIVLFRYEHDARELWRDGALVSLESRTNNNGEDLVVRAERVGDEIRIEGTGYTGAAPANAMPSSYWNKAIVSADKLLNTQTGEVIDVSTAPVGRTSAPHGDAAEHYRLVGTVALNLWYDGPQWVGSNFTIDGEELTYRLVTENETRDRLAARSTRGR